MKTFTYLAVIALSVLAMNAKAQKKHSSFGLNAGVTLASYKVKQGSVSVTGKSKIGFTAGILTDIPLGNNFSFRPGLNYTQKGGKLSEEGFTDKVTFNYIELPLNFVYNANSAKGKFFIGAGPSLSLGVSGKDKFEESGEKHTTDVKFGTSSDDDLKPFEAGVNILAGYQFTGGFFVSANYNAGLSNVANNEGSDNASMHNHHFGLRVGVMLGNRKS